MACIQIGTPRTLHQFNFVLNCQNETVANNGKEVPREWAFIGSKCPLEPFE